jgi:outer membrane murein-binding lipoprotein Lpp
MLDAIKPLLDSDLITEETRQEINEAWEAKLVEAREQARAELREEFAQRYEHDKTVMVEALDRMVTDGLSAEIQTLAAEKAQLVEDRVKFQRKMNESAAKFNNFMVTKLAEEISELRKDRKQHNEGLEKLEGFIVHALAREIQEFATDKRDVVETKVRLVREARSQLEALKARFVTESAQKMSQAVSRHLKAELGQLQEDIKVARENNFGRRIFEAYASEFGATYLNEKAEVRKLHNTIAQKDAKLSEAIKLIKNAKVLNESKEREIRMIKESNQRANVMDELLSPLNKEKQDVMRNLLESVQTSRLKNAFEKYLPAVLTDRSVKAPKVITESVSTVTGDKSARSQSEDDSADNSNVIDIKRLAGLN